jgi:hypothetical protein
VRMTERGMNCDGKHSGDLLRPDLGAVAAALGWFCC